MLGFQLQSMGGSTGHNPSQGANANADSADALDALDRQILRLLQEDARRSHRDLARTTGSTQPTVSARIRRMEDAGIIQGYTVRLDADAFVGPDVASPALVACHWCQMRTAKPLWANIGAQRHPFCCTTCKGAYSDRHAALSRGL